MVSTVESERWTKDSSPVSDKEWLFAFKYFFRYNSDDGELYWKQGRGKRIKIGDVAGTIDGEGYILIKLFGRLFKAHRVVWFMHYGSWPTGLLDHRNRKRSDNRIDNLREANTSLSNINRGDFANNTSGCKGVQYRPMNTNKPYYVQVIQNGVRHGSFHSTYEEACAKAEEVYSTIDAGQC